MPHQRPRRVRLEMEALETRDLPSASGVMAALPVADPPPAATQQADPGDAPSQADQTTSGYTAGAAGQTCTGEKGQIDAPPQWSTGGSDTKDSNSAKDSSCDDSGWSSTGGSWKTTSADSMSAGSGKYTDCGSSYSTDSWYGYDSYADSGYGYSSADWSGSSGYCDSGDGYYYTDAYALDSSDYWYGYDSYDSSYASSYDSWYGYDYSGGYDSWYYDSWYYDSYASSYSSFGDSASASAYSFTGGSSSWKSAGDFSSNFTAAADKGNANAVARSLNGDASSQAAQALQAVKSSAELNPADLGQLLARQGSDPARAGQLGVLPTQADSRHLPGSLSTPLTQAQDSLFDPFKHAIGQEVVSRGQSEPAPQQPAAVKPATLPASTEEQKPAHLPPQTFDMVSNALLANWDLSKIHAERIIDQVERLLTAPEEGIPVSAWALAAAAAATSVWAYAARQRGNLWNKLEWATPRSSWFTDGPDEA